MKYIQTKLNNGGKLHYAKNKINKATYVDVLFNCGTRCDTISGLAHFVEHMFFSGTKNLNREEVFKKYGSFMQTNAYTNIRSVTFTGTIFPNELADYLSTIASFINESTFTKEAVDKERKVINQEIGEYSDKHDVTAYRLNQYNLFELPAFKGSSGAGTVQSIAKITRKDIINFVKKYFVANNMEIYVVSPTSFNKIKKIANKTLADCLPVNEKLEKLDVDFFTFKNENFLKTKAVDIPKCYIFLNFVFNKDKNDHIFSRKLKMVLNIVNDESVGLIKTLRLKKDLVYSAYMSYGKFQNKSMLMVSCNCEKENVNEVIKTIAEYINDLLTNGFTEEQLKKIKRRLKHNEIIKTPDVNLHLSRLYDFRWFGKVLDYKMLNKIGKNITLEECNSVFKETLTNSQPSLSLYGQFEKSALMSKADFNKLFNFKGK